MYYYCRFFVYVFYYFYYVLYVHIAVFHCIIYHLLFVSSQKRLNSAEIGLAQTDGYIKSIN